MSYKVDKIIEDLEAMGFEITWEVYMDTPIKLILYAYGIREELTEYEKIELMLRMEKYIK